MIEDESSASAQHTDFGRDETAASDKSEAFDAAFGEKVLSLTIWPHRSLSPTGFRLVLLLTAVGFAIPLMAITQFAAFLVILGFAGGTLGLLWAMMKLNYRTARIRETVDIWPERIRITRDDPGGKQRVWEANPHWVRVELHDTRSIQGYLVLTASGRAVELGAFLTPAERAELAETVRRGLTDAARAVAAG